MTAKQHPPQQPQAQAEGQRHAHPSPLASAAPHAADEHFAAGAEAAEPGAGEWARRARAAGLSWLVILQLLAQGLPALIDFLNRLLAPAPAPAPAAKSRG